MAIRRKKSAKAVGRLLGFRSGLEESVAKQLQDANIHYNYEMMTINYTKPITNHKYTPDFVLPNGIIIETKGRLLLDDRKKHILVKEQHPNLDIRFVFSSSKTKISTGSKTSYADWCEKNDFKYADKLIPKEWLDE